MLSLRSCFAALAVFAALVALGGAAEFRIESKVYLKSQSVAENLTLFQDGRVYDFLIDPVEITVFDDQPNRARFLILDPARKVSTEIKVAEVTELMDKLRAWAKNAPDPFMNFLADPQFEEQFDASASTLQMNSPWMEYKLTTTEAPNAEVVEQYSQFSDWYAKLNTMTSPGRIPPFARMAVNATLKKHKQVPSDVQLTIHLKQEVKLNSEHKVAWKLLESDRQKIRQVDDYLAKFKKLSFAEYYGAEPKTTADAGDKKRK